MPTTIGPPAWRKVSRTVHDTTFTGSKLEVERFTRVKNDQQRMP